MQTPKLSGGDDVGSSEKENAEAIFHRKCEEDRSGLGRMLGLNTDHPAETEAIRKHAEAW